MRARLLCRATALDGRPRRAAHATRRRRGARLPRRAVSCDSPLSPDATEAKPRAVGSGRVCVVRLQCKHETVFVDLFLPSTNLIIIGNYLYVAV